MSGGGNKALGATLRGGTDKLKYAIVAFVILQSVLYVAFLALDLLNIFYQLGEYVKFSTIAVCALMAIFLWRCKGSATVALCAVLTLVADVFLLLIDRYYEVGVALFCAVHLLYFVRIARLRGRIPLADAPAQLLLTVAALAAVFIAGMLNALTVLSIVSFTLLLGNTLRVLPHVAKSGVWRLTFMGLALLMCCDVLVGLGNLNVAPHDSPVGFFISVGMWFFYLPSQVCLVLAGQYKSTKIS